MVHFHLDCLRLESRIIGFRLGAEKSQQAMKSSSEQSVLQVVFFLSIGHLKTTAKITTTK